MSPRLLGFFAHPDDESFGPGATLAKYAQEGAEVHICIMTDGAAGSRSNATRRFGDCDTLSCERAYELACAVGKLGATLHQFSYADSGMEGAPENKNPDSLYQAELDQVARDVARLVRHVKPHVIITHDPTGGYFHPDHIKTNHAVQRAMPRVNDPQAYPELLAEGLDPWQPQRLYYTVNPRSSLNWFIWLLRLRGEDPTAFGQNHDIDLTKLGVPNEDVHVKLNIAPYLPIKEAAGACHETQGGAGGPSRQLPRFLQRWLERFEHFQQAYPPNATRHRDLFEGVDTDQ